MTVLRQWLESDGGSTWRLGDREVIERFASEVAKGRYCLVESWPEQLVTGTLGVPSRSEVVPRPVSAATSSAPWAAAVPPPDAGRAVGPVASTTYWIEIELIGEDDQPIGDVAYTLRTPVGRVIRGRLDTSGHARVDGLESPGMCAVSFPELDRDAWDFVHALPARA